MKTKVSNLALPVKNTFGRYRMDPPPSGKIKKVTATTVALPNNKKRTTAVKVRKSRV